MRTCLDDEFSCSDQSGQCLSKKCVCDGNKQCLNGKDEDPAMCKVWFFFYGFFFQKIRRNNLFSCLRYRYIRLPYKSKNIISVVFVYNGHITKVLNYCICQISGENKIICFFFLAMFSWISQNSNTFSVSLPTFAQDACNLYCLSLCVKYYCTKIYIIDSNS